MNRFDSRYVLIGFLVVAVALAGCLDIFGGGSTEEPVDDTENETVQRVSVTQNDGLTLRFQSFSQQYSEGEPIVLELTLENTGQRVAEQIEKELFGASFIAGAQPQFPGQTMLRGVDQGNNRDGESTVIQWQVPNPVDLELGTTETFPAGARVKYNYETTARGSFTIVSSREFEGSGSPITTQTTAGPLSVSIELDSPKPVFQGATGTTQLSVPVRVTNIGDGKVADINGEPQPIHVIRAEFPNTDRASLECPPTISLFDGTRRVICTATVPTDVFEQQIAIRLDLSYDYFETQKTSFSVEGAEGDLSS